VPQAHKKEFLAHLIRHHNWQQVLVFTRTKHGANKLAEKLLKDKIPAAAIHGNKSQAARTRALAQFKDGTLQVLVATDIAARGIDIDQLPQVVNFELPNVPEDYVHRIGRTGRAGSIGAAVSLVDGEELGYLKDIERLIKRSIARVVVEGFVMPEPAAPHAGMDDEDRRPPRPAGGRGQRGQGNGRSGAPRSGGNKPTQAREGQAGVRSQGAGPAPTRHATRPTAALLGSGTPRKGRA
jgi:ATP-dependent RNA helicase RhlE